MANVTLTREQHNQLSHSVADAAMHLTSIVLTVSHGHSCGPCTANEAMNVLIGAVESIARMFGTDEHPAHALMSSAAAELGFAAESLKADEAVAIAKAQSEASAIIGGR